MNNVALEKSKAENKEVSVVVKRFAVLPATIVSMEQYKVATDIASILKMRIKNIETATDYFVDPLKAEIAEYKALFNDALTNAKNTLTFVKERMGVFMVAEQERADREQKRLEKAAMKANKGDAVVMVPVVNDVKTQRGTLGTSTMRDLPRYRVLDDKKIPKKYWMLDDAAIKAAQKAGVAIPGVEYYMEKSVTIRTP